MSDQPHRVELLNRKMCSTCPFRPGVARKYKRVLRYVAMSAIRNGRICHQTGRDNYFHKETGKPEALCRGARNLQLHCMAGMQFIEAATDEAWAAKCVEMGIEPPTLI